MSKFITNIVWLAIIIGLILAAAYFSGNWEKMTHYIQITVDQVNSWITWISDKCSGTCSQRAN